MMDLFDLIQSELQKELKGLERGRSITSANLGSIIKVTMQKMSYEMVNSKLNADIYLKF